MERDLTADVVVWGSGIVGSELARQLAADGVSVVVIPRGPASYPTVPGFGMISGMGQSRAVIQRDLLRAAEAAGARVLADSQVISLEPAVGPVRQVETDAGIYATRSVVFADGADPRVARSRGMLPDWEPWQLVHFAYVDATVAPKMQIIAANRGGHDWRGYLVPVGEHSIAGVGWFLQHELDSRVHITELLPEVCEAFGIATNPDLKPVVEVVPYHPGTLAANLVSDNLIAVGDLTGIVNPLSLRRTEISLKMANTAGSLIRSWLSADAATGFDRKVVRRAMAELTGGMYREDLGPPMPAVPKPATEQRGVGRLVRRLIDRR
jgi:flavin-dependent dehydrogenase